MNIAFSVNTIAGCEPYDTTISLARSALRRGHKVYFLSVGDCTLRVDRQVVLHAVCLDQKFEDKTKLVAALKTEGQEVDLEAGDLDVLFLRSNPADDLEARPWAQTSDILFGQSAERLGAVVLNHPETLAHAYVDKMYFEQFPEAVRPRAIITRSLKEIQRFFEAEKQKMVLKPLEGSGGTDVYLIDKHERNLKQIFESISRKGYVIAQEYLPEVKDGDIRLFMVNGRPFEVDGKYCAFRRINSQDFRSNMHQGGKAVKAELSEEVLDVARLLGPKLVHDGIFCAGLDFVGKKLVEINITSPGGMAAATRLEKVDFEDRMIELTEHKIVYRDQYNGKITNCELAVME